MQFNNSAQQKMKTKNMTTPTENALTRRVPKEGKIMSKPTLKLLPALMIAIAAALVTQPVHAGVIDSLVITENSSTSLTATLNPDLPSPENSGQWNRTLQALLTSCSFPVCLLTNLTS